MTPHGAAPAADRWRRQLGEWAIPGDILRAAPVSPWGFPTALFTRAAQDALAQPNASASQRRALEALHLGGAVLDVGVGGGAASLPLAPPAGVLTGVDESADMLRAFAAAAADRGATCRTIVGRWPDVAGEAEVADVVVCHHVLYNVAELVPFLVALNDRARRRVVVELTARHPQSDLNELWASIHGLRRPQGPTAEDALEVVTAIGFAPRIERHVHSTLWSGLPHDERIAFARRRLCVGPERDAQIGQLLDATVATTREVVTLWWDKVADRGGAAVK